VVFVEWYLRCLWFVVPLGVIVLWVTGKTLEALRSTWLPLSISIIFSLWKASLEPLKGLAMVFGSANQSDSEI